MGTAADTVALCSTAVIIQRYSLAAVASVPLTLPIPARERATFADSESVTKHATRTSIDSLTASCSREFRARASSNAQCSANGANPGTAVSDSYVLNTIASSQVIVGK